MKTYLAPPGRHEFPAIDRFPLSHMGSRTILLISDDKQLHEHLRSQANASGLMVIRATRKAGTVAVLQATQPVAVLLDLDLSAGAAWETAELLLNEPCCPAVILLTGRTDQFDMRTAIRTGSLVDKGESPSRFLEIIEETLEMPAANQAERNAIQRVLIRWLRPLGWAHSIAPAHRFWGINE
jgi:DNA-binding response OmpR family regulator